MVLYSHYSFRILLLSLLHINPARVKQDLTAGGLLFLPGEPPGVNLILFSWCHPTLHIQLSRTFRTVGRFDYLGSASSTCPLICGGQGSFVLRRSFLSKNPLMSPSINHDTPLQLLIAFRAVCVPRLGLKPCDESKKSDSYTQSSTSLTAC